MAAEYPQDREATVTECAVFYTPAMWALATLTTGRERVGRWRVGMSCGATCLLGAPFVAEVNDALALSAASDCANLARAEMRRG